MAEHHARISWTFNGTDFKKGRYSRAHTWTFDGGITVPASSSPSVVPLPLSKEDAVDPEEAFVASISSCHMLTFLFLASREGFEIASYEDEAVGTVTKNEGGVPWVSSVVLNPRVEYREGASPTAEQEAQLHHRAHEGCFISNSVKSEIRVGSH